MTTMPSATPHIFVCIPALNERDFLPATIECLSIQDDPNFSVWICVNQPEDWWLEASKKALCENNHQTLLYLQTIQAFPIHIIDRSSHGKGWSKNEGGVGHARRTLMNTVALNAEPQDIIISLDSDTRIGPAYLSSIRKNLQDHPKASALSVPYYHHLTKDEKANRAILRYEIYMRNYAINLHRIGCRYNFTALGSAMALTVKAYRKVGGMTPKKSGEDFYFLQKLRKYGPILNYNKEKAYPAARFSDRVFFGTGPAMIKGVSGDWESYPIYHYRLFDKVKLTLDAFPFLYNDDRSTPMTAFLQHQFNTTDLWTALRKNFPSCEQFVRACHEKVDALKILQYLKSEQKQLPGSDEEHLIDFLYCFYPEHLSLIPESFSFDTASVDTLDKIRDALATIEEKLQKAGADNE